MQFYKKKTLLKISGLTLLGTGLGYLSYQLHKAQEIINNALDTSIIDFMEPPIVKVQEEVRDNISTSKWLKSEKPSIFNPHWLRHRLTFAFAQRLLHAANAEDRAVRVRAIKRLGEIKSLDTWHYSILARMCDAKAAVGLARHREIDLRFFVEPPMGFVTYNHEKFVGMVKEFLVALHEKSKHVCMGYFIGEAFEDVHESGRFVDHDTHAAMNLSKFIKSADDILTMCLEPILHHSSVGHYAKDIVALNGLPLLMEIYNRFKDDVNVNLTLCRIISNICSYPEVLGEIFRSGWIGVLARWMKNNDIRISSSAAKSLANLDVDDRDECTYPQKVYLLYPMLRSDNDPDVDVVFVHGLLGGVFYTWRQRLKEDDGALGLIESLSVTDTCTSKLKKSSDPNVRQFLQDVEEHQRIEWDRLGNDYEIVWSDIPVHTNEEASGPYSCQGDKYSVTQEYDDCESYTQCWPRDWLPEDCNTLRVLGVNYDTSLSMWAPICPLEHVKTNIEERSREISQQLSNTGLGKRPIIWVTHSMGGLIVKKMLAEAYQSPVKEVRDMCLNTRGIIFYSTPHLGSRIANINHAIALVLWPSVEVQELREESPHLKILHERFIRIVHELPIKVISFVETKSTLVTAMKFNFKFVEPRSANPGVGEYYEIPQDHLCICKPLSRHSFLYQKLLDLIKAVIRDNKQ